jgi:hypothetical protein
MDSIKNVIVVVNGDDSMIYLEKEKNGERERERKVHIFLCLSLPLLTFSSSMFNIGTRSQSHKSTLNSI